MSPGSAPLASSSMTAAASRPSSGRGPPSLTRISSADWSGPTCRPGIDASHCFACSAPLGRARRRNRRPGGHLPQSCPADVATAAAVIARDRRCPPRLLLYPGDVEERRSPRAAVDAALAVIAEREDAIHAWAFLDGDRAREEAASAPVGPLTGLTLGVKDIFDTGDQPSEYGSPIYAGHRPTADAAVVALLRSAGAVVIGKTVTAELAWVTPGPRPIPIASPTHLEGHRAGPPRRSLQEWWISPLAPRRLDR